MSVERRGTKALELWARRATEGYPGVSVSNMTTAWRNGLAFCALIHSYRPDLIEFSSLKGENILENNALAYRVAEQHLGIPSLLDAEDMVETEIPDRLSILTYVSQYYQAFAAQGLTSPNRISNNNSNNDKNKNITKPTPPASTPENTKNNKNSTTVTPISKPATPSPPQTLPRTKLPASSQPLPQVKTKTEIKSDKVLLGGRGRREMCGVCSNPVFLAERILVGSPGQLMHRTCFKCARCNHQLTLASYYETEKAQFCCETCPDEELTDNDSSLKSEAAADLRSRDSEDGETSDDSSDEDPFSSYTDKVLEGESLYQDTKCETLEKKSPSSDTKSRSLFLSQTLDNSIDSANSNLNSNEEPIVQSTTNFTSVSPVIFGKEHSMVSDNNINDNTKGIPADPPDINPLDTGPRNNASPEVLSPGIVSNRLKLFNNIDVNQPSKHSVNNLENKISEANTSEHNESTSVYPSLDADLTESNQEIPICNNTEISPESQKLENNSVNINKIVNTQSEEPEEKQDNKNDEKHNQENCDLSPNEDTTTLEVHIKKSCQENYNLKPILSSSTQLVHAETSNQENFNLEAIESPATQELHDEKSSQENCNLEPIDSPATQELHEEKLSQENCNIEPIESPATQELHEEKSSQENCNLEPIEAPSIQEVQTPKLYPQLEKEISKSAISLVSIESKDSCSCNTPHDSQEEASTASLHTPKHIPRKPPQTLRPEEEEEEYPDDLNPFGSDDDDEAPTVPDPSILPCSSISTVATNNKTSPAQPNDASPKKVIKADINPFDSDDDDESYTAQNKTTDKSNLNPFWSDDEEEQDSKNSTPKVKPPRPPPPSLSKPSTPYQDKRRGSAPTKPSLPGKELFSSTPVLKSSSPSPSALSAPGGLIIKKKTRIAPNPPSFGSPSSIRSNFDSISMASTVLIEDKYEEKDEVLQCKQKKDLVNQTKKSENISPQSPRSTSPSTIGQSVNSKSEVGQWRRKKGPAPPRPVPQKRAIRKLPMRLVSQELNDIDIKQTELERQGVLLETLIRDRTENMENNDAEASPSTSSSGPPSIEVEDMILQLFDLVNEKNELFRRQTELMYLKREKRLEEEYADLEYQIRCLMMKAPTERSSQDATLEEELIGRLVKVVEQRDEIINCLELDRLREVQEDNSIAAHMMKYQDQHIDGNVETEKATPKKKKKKALKLLKKKKKDTPSEKVDADKDIDESEVKVKKKKKKWFK